MKISISFWLLDFSEDLIMKLSNNILEKVSNNIKYGNDSSLVIVYCLIVASMCFTSLIGWILWRKIGAGKGVNGGTVDNKESIGGAATHAYTGPVLIINPPAYPSVGPIAAGSHVLSMGLNFTDQGTYSLIV